MHDIVHVVLCNYAKISPDPTKGRKGGGSERERGGCYMLILYTFDKCLCVLMTTVNTVSGAKSSVSLYQEIRIQSSSSFKTINVLCVCVCVLMRMCTCMCWYM